MNFYLYFTVTEPPLTSPAPAFFQPDRREGMQVALVN